MQYALFLRHEKLYSQGCGAEAGQIRNQCSRQCVACLFDPGGTEVNTDGIKSGLPFQTLLGVTGSGKTFTMANIIEQTQRPTLILAHNKTLAAQLYSEFREFFPENEVHYFVSYFDYYQPEAYIASTDTYIEKDSAINDEIDRLRLSATAALLSAVARTLWF